MRKTSTTIWYHPDQGRAMVKVSPEAGTLWQASLVSRYNKVLEKTELVSLSEANQAAVAYAAKLNANGYKILSK